MKNKPMKIVVKDWEVARGHQPHITGTGVHGDKRTKRLRTRGDSQRNAIKTQED